MSEKQETISKIVAEMRRGTRLPGYWRSCDVNEILQHHADRLEAALERESATAESSSAVGNMAKMRGVVDLLACVALPPQEEYPAWYGGGKVPDKDGWLAWIRQAQSYAKSALAAPARNCEVGTPEGQSARFDGFCHDHRSPEKGCGDCPLNGRPCCELAWAQMPYEDSEKGEMEMLPPCTCGGEAATVERGTEPEGFAIMCSRCFRRTALHPSLALAEEEWRAMTATDNTTTKENN